MQTIPNLENVESITCTKSATHVIWEEGETYPVMHHLNRLVVCWSDNTCCMRFLEGAEVPMSFKVNYKEGYPENGEDKYKVGYKFPFTHEFEEGYKHLCANQGWENGDTLEIIHIIEGDGFKIFVVINRSFGVLTTFNFTDEEIFTPPLTDKEKAIVEIGDVLNKVAKDKLEDVYCDGQVFGYGKLAEALYEEGYRKEGK